MERKLRKAVILTVDEDCHITVESERDASKLFLDEEQILQFCKEDLTQYVVEAQKEVKRNNFIKLAQQLVNKSVYFKEEGFENFKQLSVFELGTFVIVIKILKKLLLEKGEYSVTIRCARANLYEAIMDYYESEIEGDELKQAEKAGYSIWFPYNPRDIIPRVFI